MLTTLHGSLQPVLSLHPLHTPFLIHPECCIMCRSLWAEEHHTMPASDPCICCSSAYCLLWAGCVPGFMLSCHACAVLQGRAHPGLLGSYEVERRSVALANTALSVSNWEQALRVPKALGLDPQAADLLQAAVLSRPASMLPQGMCSQVCPNSEDCEAPLHLWDSQMYPVDPLPIMQCAGWGRMLQPHFRREPKFIVCRLRQDVAASLMR